MKELSRNELKQIVGGFYGGGGSGDDQGTITHGECRPPDVGAWTYTQPVSFATCQNDVWTYCRSQWGRCY